MSDRVLKNAARLVAAFALGAGALFGQPVTVGAQGDGPLFSEGFEGVFNNDAASADCAEATCNVPDGWKTWFVKRTASDAAGVNAQPKYEQTRAKAHVKTGAAAFHAYTQQATFTGGIYRVVNNVTVGAHVKLSASGSAWSTNDESPISARPSRDVKLKIGIDPSGDAGAANPFSPQIVWSAEQSALDDFKDFTVEADARSGTVIVYLYATMKDGVRHNDVFWDDVTLSAGAAATATPEGDAPALPNDAATPTVGPPPVTASPTPEPQAATVGDTTYTIKSGDTLLKIALENGIALEELQRLNPTANAQTLQLGQELVIKRDSVRPSPTAPVPAVGARDAVLGATATLTGTPTVGAACVQAFFDDDGSGSRAEQAEDLVPQILFSLSKGGQPAGAYTSNGVDEPFCFENLPNGDYVIAATLLPIYQPSTPINDSIVVRGGRSYFSLGVRRIEDGGRNVSITPTPVPRAEILSVSNALSLLAILGGLLMIAGLIGFVISAFLRQRRL